MEKNQKSVFEVLNAINVNEHTEKKNNLTYLSWAWAWAEVKKHYPDAYYTIYENRDGLNYHTDGRTCWVKTGVTINGLEHIEYLPVLDRTSHSSLLLNSVTSWDVNKAIQRSLTKAVARHGLGLYIYAGEELPNNEQESKPSKTNNVKPKPVTNNNPNLSLEDKLGAAVLDVEACKSEQDLVTIYNAYKADLGQEKRFLDALKEKKAQINENAA